MTFFRCSCFAVSCDQSFEQKYNRLSLEVVKTWLIYICFYSWVLLSLLFNLVSTLIKFFEWNTIIRLVCRVFSNNSMNGLNFIERSNLNWFIETEIFIALPFVSYTTYRWYLVTYLRIMMKYKMKNMSLLVQKKWRRNKLIKNHALSKERETGLQKRTLLFFLLLRHRQRLLLLKSYRSRDTCIRTIINVQAS